MPRRRHVVLARRALRDLAGVPKQQLSRLRAAHEALASGAENLDIAALKGRPGWYRLRTGDYRTLYRRASAEELRPLGLTGEGFLVARVVNKRDAVKAIATLR